MNKALGTYMVLQRHYFIFEYYTHTFYKKVPIYVNK